MTTQTPREKNVTGKRAQELLASPQTFILDVRTLIEFQHGALDRATAIPVDVLHQNLEKLPEDKSHPILVYCAHGRRSLVAQEFLERNGYTTVLNLEGGLASYLRWLTEQERH